jgi:L-threonylcarbamoyladenylate synthase
VTVFRETRVLAAPDAEAPAICEAAEILRAGGLVAFPTETVYGLGADGLNPDAVARIFEAKGRPATNPLILHVGTIAEARRLATCWPETAQRLAERHWPGPLTLVLPAAPEVPAIVRAGNPTVALRCPAHPVALSLVRQTGRPLAAPSANRSTGISPTRAEHVVSSLGGRLELVLDGGPTQAGLESTIIDLHGAAPRLLRPGPIEIGELEALIGPVRRWSGAVAEGETQAAPGMSIRHYAPRTTLRILDREDLAAAADEASGPVAVVALGTLPELPLQARGFLLPARPEAVGTELYALLHDLDGGGFSAILFERPPAGDAWMAVADRLTRASAEG